MNNNEGREKRADLQKTIPIVVGITGHRDIRKEDEEKLKKAFQNELKKLKVFCPNSQLVVLTNLAKGADLLCAEVAKEMKLPLYIALPMDRSLYGTTQQFSVSEKEFFEECCNNAERNNEECIFITPIAEPVPNKEIEKELEKLKTKQKDISEEAKQYLYRQASIYIVAHCHVLLALWDGSKAKGNGCGTAEAVKFAENGIYSPLSGISFRSSSNESVIHIYTPRGTRNEKEAGTVETRGNWNAVEEVIKKTDKFNKLAQGNEVNDFYLLPADFKEKKDIVLEHINNIYHISDNLSVAAQKKYRKTLKQIAWLGALITFFFLLYDEAEMIWLIVVCGLALCAGYRFLLEEKDNRYHERYLEYRVLAEDLRVQAYLRYAGSSLQIANLLPWTQQEETAWIIDALSALVIGKEPEESNEENIKENIKECWLIGQKKYHESKIKKPQKDNVLQEVIAKWTLRTSIVLYLVTLGFELLCGGLPLIAPIVKVSDMDFWRSVLKIALGTASAMAVFAADYYGKLSPQRILADHKKMLNFYNKMLSLLDNNPGLPEELLKTMAHEMLIENGNWYSYQKDNTPDINL